MQIYENGSYPNKKLESMTRDNHMAEGTTKKGGEVDNEK